jgi:type IV secretion system protein VirB11
MNAHNQGPNVYLFSYLAALQPYLSRDDVTDLYVNRPGELLLETLDGNIERHERPDLDTARLARLSTQIAALSSQGISREHPLLSASLPDGSRVQIVGPPATRGPLALAIRKHLRSSLSLDDYVSTGAFAETLQGGASTRGNEDRELNQAYERGDNAALLKLAIAQRRNIVVSGGTSTGKTTFLNALLREVPRHERLILIEDAPELVVDHPNTVGLIAARSALGEAVVTANDLLNASLRMRPDRIILGELRGGEAFTFLRAVNTGHPGSMTTIHADSPLGAIEQIALLVLQTGTRLDHETVVRYVLQTVDVYVQLGRQAGRRHVSEIMLSSRLTSADADTR